MPFGFCHIFVPLLSICCPFILRTVPPTPRRGKETWLDRESPIVQPDLCIKSMVAHCLGQWTDTSDSRRLAQVGFEISVVSSFIRRVVYAVVGLPHAACQSRCIFLISLSNASGNLSCLTSPWHEFCSAASCSHFGPLLLWDVAHLSLHFLVRHWIIGLDFI